MATFGTFVAGQVLTAAELNAPMAWTSYTPALTSSGTQPVLGTGSIATGKYVQINKFVFGYFNIAFGTSGITAGTGNYLISLPRPSSRTTGAFWEYNIGTGTFGDASGGNDFMVKFNFNDANTIIAYYWTSFNAQLAAVSATAPVTIAASDRFSGFFCYEAATAAAA
tara:strand:- start:795 stop:1295 length:501 start_codon:yes stop_codon:yes gene_type:complete